MESIEPINLRPQGTGACAVIGGILGAVVGNQPGHGRTRVFERRHLADLRVGDRVRVDACSSPRV